MNITPPEGADGRRDVAANEEYICLALNTS